MKNSASKPRLLLWWRNFVSNFSFVWRITPSWTSVKIGHSILTGLLPLVLIFLVKIIIDLVTNAGQQTDIYQVYKILAYLVGTYMIIASLNAVAGLLHSYYSELITNTIYDSIHKKAGELPIAFYQNSAFYDKLFRAREDASSRPQQMTAHIAALLQSIISLATIVGILLYLKAGYILLLALAFVPLFAVRRYFSQQSYNWQQKNTANLRKKSYFHRILTGEAFASEIRLFGLIPLFSERFNKLKQQLFADYISLQKRQTLYEIGAQLVVIAALGVALTVITKQAYKQEISIGDFVLYFMILQRAVTYFRSLSSSISGLYDDQLFLSNYWDFLNMKPTPQHTNLSKTEFNGEIRECIKFENVSFKYPEGRALVFENLNTEIPSGKMTAIVGANGSGKSTLSKLLAGFYQPDSGTIYYDDKPLNNYTFNSIMGNISAVFQDFVLYHLTAKENIAFGNPRVALNYDRIVSSAVKSDIYDVLKNLPKGLDTTLGKLFENSEELSIGQWQRVALARAFYKDAPILIFDEPTSAMDALSEYSLFQSLSKYMVNKTTIVISHRFSTVKMADHIIVLDNKKMVESGNHESLLALNGLYARMFRTQSQAYL